MRHASDAAQAHLHGDRLLGFVQSQKAVAISYEIVYEFHLGNAQGLPKILPAYDPARPAYVVPDNKGAIDFCVI